MKNIILIILGLLLFISCSETNNNENHIKTNQQIAEENISSYLKRELNDPSSYKSNYFGKLSKIDTEYEFNINLKKFSNDSTLCLDIQKATKGCYRLEHHYTAKNKFNAKIKEIEIFVLDSKLKVKPINKN
jgi:hypothetical protein